MDIETGDSSILLQNTTFDHNTAEGEIFSTGGALCIGGGSSTVDAFEAMDGSVDTSPGSDLEKLLSSLIGLTDGGTFTGNFIQDVKDFVEVGPDETAPPEKLVASMRDAGENLLFTVTAEETFGETGYLEKEKGREVGSHDLFLRHSGPF